MAEPTPQTIRIGTRGSALALWQANWVAGEIRNSGHQAAITILKTGGDISDLPLSSMGGIGVFTKEIQRALLANEVDIAVHSLKDLPTEPAAGLELAVVPPRASAHDTLVLPSNAEAKEKTHTIDSLPAGSRIGTGSIRRQAQLLSKRPDLQVQDIRGNVDTRLRKLDAGEYDALVLAEAGLRRLELADRIGQQIDLGTMVPAVGQGALGIETRSGDAETISVLKSLDDQATHLAVLTERSLLATLLAGCLAPVGAHATWHDGTVEIVAIVLAADGTAKIEEQCSAACSDAAAAVALGHATAEALLAQGAAELIATSRQA